MYNIWLMAGCWWVTSQAELKFYSIIPFVQWVRAVKEKRKRERDRMRERKIVEFHLGWQNNKRD